MKFKILFLKRLPFLLLPILIINCRKDDNPEYIPTGQSKEYAILNTNFSDLTGLVKFIENTDGSTTISVELNNTVKGINNPVRLRRNTANIGGDIAVNLNEVKGEDGSSSTTISKLVDGETITFNQLAEFDGYIAIEDNSTSILIAYSDIGPNELTGQKISFDLLSPNGTFNGLVTIEERKKSTSALTIGVFGLSDNEELPCTLNILENDSIKEIIHQLSPVKSSFNGFSFNELTEINGKVITYEQIRTLNAYIEVTNPNSSANFYAKGFIKIE
ncbi:hypothetical protein [Maribacter aquivivus]|uniref:hypothetical protein n=1 Tax=Maribacter aquivivus TaxID=228958 RepID=UPI00249516A0|nr:hypothetical protein [Maribacter aquivivus]